MTEAIISLISGSAAAANKGVRPAAEGTGGFKKALAGLAQTEQPASPDAVLISESEAGKLGELLLSKGIDPAVLQELLSGSTDSAELAGLELSAEEQEQLAKMAADIAEGGESEIDETVLAEIGTILSQALFRIYSSVKASSDSVPEQILDDAAAVRDIKLAKLITLLEPGVLPESDRELTGEMAKLLEKMAAKLKQAGEGPIQQQNQPAGVKEGQANPLDMARSAFIRVMASPLQTAEETKAVQSETQLQASPVPQNLPMAKLEQYVIFAASKPEAADQEKFIKQFQQILGKANFTANAGMQKLMIRLNPEHLGSMRIELFQKDSVMTARIIASTQTAKEMLDSQLNGLKQSFAGQGIQIDKIEISQQETSFSQERFNKNGSSSEDSRQQQEEAAQGEESQADFTGSLAEALLNIEV